MAFTSPLDIVNFAALRLGQPRISAFTDNAKIATEGGFAYDRLRVAELGRNLWRFATKRVILRAVGIDTVLWTPATWASGQSYKAGTVVNYTPTSGVYANQLFSWQLSAAETSSTTPDFDPLFHHYAGPIAIDLYNTGSAGDGTSNTTYNAGEVVLVPATYASGTTYAKNDVVNSGGNWYVSLIASNLGNAVTDTAAWVLWTSLGRSKNSYGVTASNSPVPLTYPAGYSVYISLYSNNADNPVSATGTWLSVGGTVAELSPLYPIGAGPISDLTTTNAFHLPNGYLKRAPTDAKGNQTPYLGAAYGATPEDWEPESDYFISGDPGPMLLRFVADVVDVTDMDPLFCVGLAERIAQDICETVTGSDAKVQLAERGYKKAMGDARTSNAIEIGPITPVENRLVTVRA